MPRTSRSARPTTDHDEIRRWVESKGGHPAAVKGTGGGDDPGILRIDFPGFSGEGKLESISWEKFFEYFEANNLAFIYQDVEESRFNKLVSRDGVKAREGSSGEYDAEAESEGEAHQAEEATVSAQSTKEAGGIEVEGANMGRTDALSLLSQQHREIKDLFDEYEHTSDGTSAKQQLFEKIADSLAAHSEIEEKLFYPTVMANRTEEEQRESVEEHLAVKRVIADLLSMPMDDPQFDPKMKVMQDLTIHHVEEEEQRLFGAVREIDSESLLALGDMMKTAFEKIMTEEPRKKVPRETKSAAPLS